MLQSSGVGISPAPLLPQAAGDAVDGFEAWLVGRGYSPVTIAQTVMFARGLVRRLEAKAVALGALDEQRIAAATKRRSAQVPATRRRAALHFLEYLRDRGIAAPRQVVEDDSPCAQVEERYVRHLRQERSLAASTVVNYRGFARQFLRERFGRGPAQLADLTPRDLADFLLRHHRTMSAKRAQLMSCALRSFLRFLFLEGQTKTDLSPAVPTVRQFKKTATPRHLPSEDVERLLTACDPATAVGRRNHAVLLLLARLGLRASEIVKLELEDIRWRSGELLVRGKGEHYDRLPLPEDVGAALALYLRRDRASCEGRRVFLCMRAPRRGLSSPSTVSTIVERTLERCGLHPPHRGAHLLRHSLATAMIRRGASMAEIGQLLRHRSANTTELYAKVDFEGLRGVALPWPSVGGAQ